MEEIIKESTEWLFNEKHNGLSLGGAVVLTILGYSLLFDWIKRGVIRCLKLKSH